MTRSIIFLGRLLETAVVLLLLTLNHQGLFVSGCSNHDVSMDVVSSSSSSSSSSNISSSISSHHGDDPFHHVHSLSDERRLTNTGGGRGRGGASFCGTQSMSVPRQLQVFEEMDEWRRRNKRRLQTGGPYTIDVLFVHFKNSANEEDFPLANVNANMDLLNQHFANSPFSFNLLRVDEVVDATFATCASEDKDLHAQMGLAHREGDATLLNVFLCTFPDEVLRGKAYYPYTYPQVLETDIIYIDPTVIGENKWTLTHELGHWMGLLHTFENACSYPGDGIRDTPYQKEVVDTDIISCDQPTDSCPGMPGVDPIDNVMGYVNKCYAGFSAEQIDLMHLVYEKYRLSRPGFCYMDLFITFNANPADITIYLASDSIHYKTIDGSEYTPNQSVVIASELDHGKGSITVWDTNSNGFSGGTIKVEVLENGNSNSIRSIAAEIIGDGSFQGKTTVEFMLPESCIAVQVTSGPKQATTTTEPPAEAPVAVTPAPVTAPAVDSTPAPTKAAVSTTTEAPIAAPAVDTTAPPTQAPVTATTEAPVAAPVSATSTPAATSPVGDTPATTEEETLSPTSSPKSNISTPGEEAPIESSTSPPPLDVGQSSTPSHAYSSFQSSLFLLPSIGLAILHVAVSFIA